MTKRFIRALSKKTRVYSSFRGHNNLTISDSENWEIELRQIFCRSGVYQFGRMSTNLETKIWLVSHVKTVYLFFPGCFDELRLRWTVDQRTAAIFIFTASELPSVSLTSFWCNGLSDDLLLESRLTPSIGVFTPTGTSSSWFVGFPSGESRTVYIRKGFIQH